MFVMSYILSFDWEHVKQTLDYKKYLNKPGINTILKSQALPMTNIRKE